MGASWNAPDPSGDPYYPIDSFPTDANCAEPYQIKVTDTGSTAWYIHDGDNGGYLKLDVEVFDWQAPHNPDGVPGEITGLWLEGEVVTSPVDLLALASPIPGGDTSSVYQVEIHGLNLTKSGPNEIWIIAESADPVDYEPQIVGDTSMWTYPDNALSAYLRTQVLISDIQPEFSPIVTSIDPTSGDEGDLVPATVYGQYFADGCEVELRESGGTFVVEADNESWVDETEVTCDLYLTGAPIGLYDVVVINPSTLEGSLDEGFEVTQADVIYVDDSNTSGNEDGSMENPYNTIQEGLAAASAGYEVWVDDSDGQYPGQVVLVAGVDLLSVNWDDTDGDDEATIFISSSSSCVLGADNATIDGFEIDAVYCGIECNGTSPEIIDCRVVDIYHNSARAIWLRNNSHAHLDGVEVFDVTNSNYYGYATFYGILVENCDAAGDDRVVIEHTTVHKVYSAGLLGGGYCYPHGIYITGSDGVVVKNSIIHDVTGGNYHYTYGVRVYASTDVELVNNVIYDIDKQYYY